MTDQSLKISEFCTAEKVSRSMLYKLWEQGRGPRFFNIGISRRISYDARTEWRRAREVEAADRVSEAGPAKTAAKPA